MPKMLKAWTDPERGTPVALWADDARIHPKDFATVWRGVQQYNADLVARGAVPEMPAEALATPVVFDDDGAASDVEPDAVDDKPVWQRHTF